MEKFDLVIIGGGVIGCATLRACLNSLPTLSACLIEQEEEVAVHQSGRNSGVLHVGYNQKPATMKAKFVVEGNRRLRSYLREKNIAITENGILIVARFEDDLSTLEELKNRGLENGAKVEIVDSKRMNEIEPAANGIGGLFAPEGASFDSRSYVKSLFEDAIKSGATSYFGERVENLKESQEYIEIQTSKRIISTRLLVVAGGLYADDLAHMMGIGKEYHVFPFRGEYYELVKGAELVKSHIYPAPNLKFPFLGVHLSRTFDDKVKAGPGALLAFGRNCYEKFSIHPLEFLRMLSTEALWKLFGSHDFRTVLKQEWKRSLFLEEVLKEARLLVPDLPDKCFKSSPAGIRAQIVSDSGELIDDLTILETKRSIHVLNAVSPALTCSLPFADHVTDLVMKRQNLIARTYS